MRAGSLSETAVKRRLKKSYVCAWHNTEGDPCAGGSIGHPPSDPAPTCIRGNGEHNVQALILTPAGKILHVAGGYLSGPDLIAALDFAEKLWEKVQPLEEVSARENVVRETHKRAGEAAARKTFTGPLADFTKRQVLQDHRYMERHPLIPATAYRIPDHVGNAKTFFSSQRGPATTRPGIGAPRSGMPPSTTTPTTPRTSDPERTKKALEKLLDSQDVPEHMKDILKDLIEKAQADK